MLLTLSLDKIWHGLYLELTQVSGLGTLFAGRFDKHTSQGLFLMISTMNGIYVTLNLFQYQVTWICCRIFVAL